MEHFEEGLSSKNNIQKLPQDVVNRIAAGEVIERPAAVVKELVENAIDAKADEISVLVEEGGKTYIKIKDNGNGINQSDLPLAISPHATSKLKDFVNISNINSLGFRGEALASIGSVSHLKIKSKSKDSEKAYEIELKVGEASDVRPAVLQSGTEVEVIGLFSNIPARAKFLKNKSTEISYINAELHKIAIANPTIAFSLYHSNRKVFKIQACKDLTSRIKQLFKKDLVDSLLPFNNYEPKFKIEGFISNPTYKRLNNNYIFVFLNNRPIKDKNVIAALLKSYREFMPSGSYPASFIFITMPTTEFDVNVHPQKTEVRFFRKELVFARLRNLTRSVLTNASQMPVIDLNDLIKNVVDARAANESRPAAQKQSDSDNFSDAKSKENIKNPMELATQKALQQKNFGFTPNADSIHVVQPKRMEILPDSSQNEYSSEEVIENEANIGQDCDADTESAKVIDNKPQISAEDAFHLRPDIFISPVINSSTNYTKPTSEIIDAYQIKNSYILVEFSDRVEIIDQHALHERILFEQLRKKFESSEIERQRLLTPEILDMDRSESEKLKDLYHVLDKIGFEIAYNKVDELWEVKAVPMLLSKRYKVKEILEHAIDELINTDFEPDFVKVSWQVLATIACKAAIKAGDRLSKEEMFSLLENSHLVETTFACPHGRPTSIVIPLKKLDKFFDR